MEHLLVKLEGVLEDFLVVELPTDDFVQDGYDIGRGKFQEVFENVASVDLLGHAPNVVDQSDEVGLVQTVEDQLQFVPEGVQAVVEPQQGDYLQELGPALQGLLVLEVLQGSLQTEVQDILDAGQLHEVGPFQRPFQFGHAGAQNVQTVVDLPFVVRVQVRHAELDQDYIRLMLWPRKF